MIHSINAFCTHSINLNNYYAKTTYSQFRLATHQEGI